jgi:hypothetical protein
MADLAARRAAENSDKSVISCDNAVSLIFLRRKAKELLLQKWQNHYSTANKGQIYQNLNTKPAWKTFNSKIKTSRIVWSSYMQLKLGHGYFKSYLKRLPDYNSDKCDCNSNSIQSPAHLLLNCSKYQSEYQEFFSSLSNSILSLSVLLNTIDGVKAVCKFLEKTQIVRRNWISI